ncbi:hypothetical protein NIES3585_01700 [Nodularia sp. NIES-3585]|nr:hypothetical protein NIES3585_01700 [Nodularia sp. NIES-3585]
MLSYKIYLWLLTSVTLTVQAFFGQAANDSEVTEDIHSQLKSEQTHLAELTRRVFGRVSDFTRSVPEALARSALGAKELRKIKVILAFHTLIQQRPQIYIAGRIYSKSIILGVNPCLCNLFPYPLLLLNHPQV